MPKARAIMVEHTVWVLCPGLELNKVERQRLGMINQGKRKRARSNILSNIVGSAQAANGVGQHLLAIRVA